MNVKVAVPCINAAGQSDFHITTIESAIREIKLGVHFELAIEAAKDDGYDVSSDYATCFDDQESLGKDLIKWLEKRKA